MAYQIPPAVTAFVDREGEQERAVRAVEGWRDAERPLCLALRGLGGAGKTELAYRLARTLRDRHPDGVLYLDLDDLRRGGVVETADAVGELLRSLGVGEEWLGQSLAARCKQYWTRTDGRRLVVVLDNARYGAEVLPLLPASGASTVIVASQGPLYDMDGAVAVDIPVEPLAGEHAVELLRQVAGAGDARLAAEPEALEGLVRLCSGLPAALHVAARWLRRHRRRPLSRLLGELSAELHDRGLPVVERVWDAAYRELGADAAVLYRLLGGHPARSFTPQAAAALLGRGADAADDALEELETAGLLAARGERLLLPDLLRAHAQRCDRQDGGEEERAGGRRRMVRWYLRQAQRADRALAGARLTLADEAQPVPGAPDVVFGESDGAGEAVEAVEAARWLEAERHALYGAVRLAHAHGMDAEAWALCEPLWTHYLDHPHYADALDAFRTGRDAAQRAGHVPALVRMRCQTARPLWEQGRPDEAGQELEAALAAAGALGESAADRKLRASAVEFRGTLHAVREDWAAAAADFEASRAVHRALGNAYGVLLLTYRLGQARTACGEPAQAAALLAEARAAAAAQGRERMTARTGFALGDALRGLGRRDEARELYREALVSARRRGAGAEEARVLDALGSLAEEAGEAAEAAAHRAAARDLRERSGAVAG